MRRLGKRLIAARALGAFGLITAAAATPLAAQLKGLPMYGDASVGGLWAVWLDLGSGVNDASGHSHHIGARLSGGAGCLTLVAGGGLWDTATGSNMQVGSTAGLRLFGGAPNATTVGLVAGVGYARSGSDSTASTYVTTPLAIAVTLNRVGLGGHALIPWVAPRVELDRIKFPGVKGDQAGIGMSAGVGLPLTNRLGLYGAIDWLDLFQRSQHGVTLLGGTRLTAGVGARVLLSAPRP